MDIGRTVGAALSAACFSTGCVGNGKDTAHTPPACPSDIESFCLYEFGGACPTHEEVAAMYCDDYHFAPAASSGTAVHVDTSDVDGCPYPHISCFNNDTHNWTRVYFTELGPAGEVIAVSMDWDDDDDCPGYVIIGDPLC